MNQPHFQTLLNYIDARYPSFVRGINEARARKTHRFDQIAELFLDWAIKAKGSSAITECTDAFVRFTSDVNLAQARYEASGKYENKTFEEVYKNHYSQKEQMDDYLWGVYLTNFLWAHHLDISLFFEDRFISRLDENAKLIEIAPGHGGWGVWALHARQDLVLEGFDISPSSIAIASSIAQAAKVHQRANYLERNALDLTQLEAQSADGLICSFLVEHLEEPSKLFRVIKHLLKPNGSAFVTGALTAAQVDHIFEIHHESELIHMAESEGLRAMETISTNPNRLLPKAKFVPRSMAMILKN